MPFCILSAPEESVISDWEIITVSLSINFDLQLAPSRRQHSRRKQDFQGPRLFDESFYVMQRALREYTGRRYNVRYAAAAGTAGLY